MGEAAMNPPMGLTFVEVVFTGEAGSRGVYALVDSGARYSVLPASLAESLGARHVRLERFELADGREVTWRLGQLDVECQGRRVTTLVVFGEGADVHLLGVYALEGLGLELDPVHKELRPVKHHPLYHTISSSESAVAPLTG